MKRKRYTEEPIGVVARQAEMGTPSPGWLARDYASE